MYIDIYIIYVCIYIYNTHTYFYNIYTYIYIHNYKDTIHSNDRIRIFSETRHFLNYELPRHGRATESPRPVGPPLDAADLDPR